MIAGFISVVRGPLMASGQWKGPPSGSAKNGHLSAGMFSCEGTRSYLSNLSTLPGQFYNMSL
jgi:hypothetical protein